MEIALARALGIPSDALAAAHVLARRLADHGERERARRIWAGCLALDPGDREAALALATLALEDGDAAAALDAAGRALEAAPGWPEAELQYARALLLFGKIADARASLARIADRDPRARALQTRLGG